MKKGTIILVLAFLVSVAAFLILLNSYGLSSILAVFLKVRLWHIGVIIGFVFIYLWVFNIKWQRILRLEGLETSMKDLFVYRLAGYAVSYLTPAADIGGEPVMAYLLSRDYKEVNFTKSFAAVVTNRLVGMVSTLSFAVLALMYVLFFFVLPKDVEFVFYIVLGLIVVLMGTIYYLVIHNKNPLDRALKKTGLYKIEIVRKTANVKDFDNLLNNFFHENPKELFINIILSVIGTLALIGSFWSLAYFLGFGMNFFDALTAQTIHSISSSVIPVPANIGVAEAGESAWFSILGYGGVSGFGFYLVLRIKDIFYSIIGLGALFYKGVWDDVVKMVKSMLAANGLDAEEALQDK